MNLFNSLGQLITALANGEVEAGNHEVTFNAGNLSSGVYLYGRQAGAYVEVKKMLVMK